MMLNSALLAMAQESFIQRRMGPLLCAHCLGGGACNGSSACTDRSDAVVIDKATRFLGFHTKPTQAADQRPVKLGDRFSRNAATPS